MKIHNIINIIKGNQLIHEFELQELYRSLLVASPDAITVTDTKCNIIMTNQQAVNLHGYNSVEEMVGLNAFDLIAPQDRERAKQNTIKTLTDGKILNEHYTLLRKDGSTFLGELSASLILDVAGKPKAFIGVLRDISKQKNAEEKLTLLNQYLLKSNNRLKELALRDSQTGLYNHRYMSDFIEAEFQRASRHTSRLSVIMLDIDYFKSINDVYGHRFGDMILKQFARYIRKIVRKYDAVARFGGEEFVIISTGADRTSAVKVAERLLNDLNVYEFGDTVHKIRLKISMGISSYPEDEASKGMDLINIADKILNKAKEDGGNRVYSSCDLKPMSVRIPEKHPIVNYDVSFLKNKLEKLTKRTNQSLMEAIFAFAKTIKLKDRYTGEHVKKTVAYAAEIAKTLRLDTGNVEHIREAAMLHDLGKIGISEKILLKKSKLTLKEYNEIKKHPQIAVDILRPIHVLHDILPLILYHHERWDGKGYPSGLKGNDIPLGARIIALSDVYQALISDRPYRPAYPKEMAVRIIKHNTGSLFDPKIVRTFIGILSKEKNEPINA